MALALLLHRKKLKNVVESSVARNKAALIEQRYRFNAFKIMQEVREALPWADGKQVKNEVDVQIFDLLGEKTAADLAPPPKKQKEKKPVEVKTEQKNAAAVNEADSASDGASSIAELMKTKVHFHAPGENYKTDGYVVTPNTERLLKDHLKITGGKHLGVLSVCVDVFWRVLYRKTVHIITNWLTIGLKSLTPISLVFLRQSAYPLPTGAKRYPSHRSRQSHQHQFRLCQGTQWHL